LGPVVPRVPPDVPQLPFLTAFFEKQLSKSGQTSPT